jgi:Putative Ig domain
MSQPIWNTPAGSIGTFPYDNLAVFPLSASPVLPATSISSYVLLAGVLPTGMTLNTTTGVISGIPTLVLGDNINTFTIRVTDNLGNLRDRTFTMTISGTAIPYFNTPAGILLSTQDSIWTQINIEYTNPDPANEVIVELQEGVLPPGLELSTKGLIQGYPEPPVINTTLPAISTVGFSTDATTGYIYVLSINGITPGRLVTFTTPIGGILAGVTYYVKTVNTDLSAFTISSTQNGVTFPVTTATGGMTISIPSVSVGQPTIRTYNFVLRLASLLGGNTSSYSITVINQQTPVSQGGPGRTPNTRLPTLLNTRPTTINISDSDPYYGYYILPPVAPSSFAQIGTILSDDNFAFKMLGYDFDGNPLQYLFSNLPSWLSGDSNTGWLTGTPTLANPGINSYSFNVSVRKTGNPSITSPNFNFALNVSKDVTGVINWTTPSDLGTIYNEVVSTLRVRATSDVPLEYRITSGSLPPNLELLSNGEITGFVATQPTGEFLNVGDSTDFTCTIQAYSTKYVVVESSRTFTLKVLQEFGQPTDILYIKATPSIQDRNIIESLLTDETLIPTESLYRPNDIYFGKATSVIYEHAYGIYASDIDQYIAAVTKNHYWRNITLGELKTAVAKNDAGEIIYEVVYSEVIDNLVNPSGISVPSDIYWPRPINLDLGPWYTSVTDVFTSYENLLGQEYYTSLSPGYAQALYPNSLFNMRNRVANINYPVVTDPPSPLGQEYNSKLLPLWMTSQQSNGSTLGYTPAWVICYTKPYLANSIKDKINTQWPYTLNQINFNIDRFSVNKSATYDYDNNLNPPAWTGLPSGQPVPDPLDSKDFYVLFPRQTILPDKTQY